MTPVEQERARALLAALLAEVSGPQLSGRVRRRQEEILTPEFTPIDPVTLGAMIAKLDGVTSTARHLGVAPTTVQKWRRSARIPSKALAKMAELIAAGARTMRKPNRDRHRG